MLYKNFNGSRDIAILFIAAGAAFIFVAMANNMTYKFSNVVIFSMAGMVKGRLEGKLILRERSDV
jgi:hypothetical protein